MTLKSVLRPRLQGTWVHHAVWRRKHPPLADRSAEYDRLTIEVLFRVLRRNSNCVDVGAHQGDILRSIVDITPKGNHHAFEPLPQLAAELRRNFPQVTVHQNAVGDKSCKSEFLFVRNDPAYSGLRRRRYVRPDPDIEKIPVDVVTLDEAIPQTQPIAFIKLDIEGGEFHAIRGASQTIQRTKPILVFESGSHSIAHYGITPEDVWTLLDKVLHYNMFTLNGWLRKRPSLSFEEYAHYWNEGPEYFFLTAPR